MSCASPLQNLQNPGFPGHLRRSGKLLWGESWTPTLEDFYFMHPFQIHRVHIIIFYLRPEMFECIWTEVPSDDLDPPLRSGLVPMGCLGEFSLVSMEVSLKGPCHKPFVASARHHDLLRPAWFCRNSFRMDQARFWKIPLNILNISRVSKNM